MSSKYIKARCARKDKWFALEVAEQHGTYQIINFVDLTNDEARGIRTEVPGSSFRVADFLHRCAVCGTDRAGLCSHVEHPRGSSRPRCDQRYSYQCLFCEHLRISDAGVDESVYSEWVGVSNIPGATPDRFGNPEGSQYDLARDGGFAGHGIVILCLYTGEGILEGIRQPIASLEKKGFHVDLCTSATPQELQQKLSGACQLWVVSDRNRHLTDGHLSVIRTFWEAGNGLYILGDNDPYYADANYLAQALAGVTMGGNSQGDKVIGVQKKPGEVGLIAGHPISTGIVNLYEGITIASVDTNTGVRPLVNSTARKTVTAIFDDGQRRMLIDGGFTRLFYKWNTAGTDRFVVNCAAWLAGGSPGGERRFT